METAPIRVTPEDKREANASQGRSRVCRDCLKVEPVTIRVTPVTRSEMNASQSRPGAAKCILESAYSSSRLILSLRQRACRWSKLKDRKAKQSETGAKPCQGVCHLGGGSISLSFLLSFPLSCLSGSLALSLIDFVLTCSPDVLLIQLESCPCGSPLLSVLTLVTVPLQWHGFLYHPPFTNNRQ